MPGRNGPAGLRIHGYIRVSTAQQAEDDRASLPEQERQIKLVAALKGVRPLMYRDDISAAIALHKRPGGAAMLAAIQPGDIIIASKLDRMFRSAIDALTQLDELKRRDVDLILLDSGTEPILSSAVGRLFFGMLAQFAEFERSRIRERILEGKAIKHAAGGFTGGHAPYGKSIDGIGLASKLIDDSREIELIGLARGRRGAGCGYNSIARELTALGYTSRRGTPLTATQVWRWLQN
jgi:putative DNA-invertase from lambdoid prophage Rac